MQLPYYDMPAHPRFSVGSELVHTLKIVDFLRYIIERDQLTISSYLDQMAQEPFFLVAATGLGKTVAVPLHILIRVMQDIGNYANPQPRIWVVEPRIPIATNQAQFMNSLWQEYLRAKGERSLPPLFGCVSSTTGSVNPNAPIQFVTTGIFELMATTGKLAPERDRIIIDEAHVTIEQNPGVELGIALARSTGVPVDYMSATVDTTTLARDLSLGHIIRADQQRHVVWKANLWQPLDKALPDLIECTLIQPDATSDYYPQPATFRHANQVTRAVLEAGRSHGMMVVVNSFAGDQSDVGRLASLVRQKFPDLPVLLLASEVIRDAVRERAFCQDLAAIEAAKQNYVILATSVVEMGITFPTLDYLITMDCGYDQETIGDQTFPVVAPLGVNSLMQRIGRVGRRRPGIAYIASEVGADYAELEDTQLNGAALRYEPIRFPLASAPLMPLAYFACTQDWEDRDEWVASLDLPSKLHQNPERMEYLQNQFDLLVELGLADTKLHLTPLGERMEQWIGRADLAYAVRLQQRFEEGCDLPELMFWVVSTALSNMPLATLRAQHDYFVDYTGSHASIAHRIELWENHQHEDIALFCVIAVLAVIVPGFVFTEGSLDEFDDAKSYRWCNTVGIDSRKLQKAGGAIQGLWQHFCRINRKTTRFEELFDVQKTPELVRLPWHKLFKKLPRQELLAALQDMPGTVEIRLSSNDTGGLQWTDRAGHSGAITQEDTPIRLRVYGAYRARPVPSRKAKGHDLAWRLAHFGLRTRPTA